MGVTSITQAWQPGQAFAAIFGTMAAFSDDKWFHLLPSGGDTAVFVVALGLGGITGALGALPTGGISLGRKGP